MKNNPVGVVLTISYFLGIADFFLLSIILHPNSEIRQIVIQKPLLEMTKNYKQKINYL